MHRKHNPRLSCLSATLTLLFATQAFAANLTSDPLTLTLARHTPHPFTIPLLNTDTKPLATRSPSLQISSSTVHATLQSTTCPSLLPPAAQCEYTFSLLSTYPRKATPIEISLNLQKKTYARQAALLTTTPYLTTVLVNPEDTNTRLTLQNQTNTVQPLSDNNTLPPLTTQSANPSLLTWATPTSYQPPVNILKNNQQQIIGYQPVLPTELISFHNAPLTISLPPSLKNTVYDLSPLLPYFTATLKFVPIDALTTSPTLTLTPLPAWTAQQTGLLQQPPVFAQEIRSLTVALYLTTSTPKKAKDTKRIALSITPPNQFSTFFQQLTFDTSYLYSLPANAAWSLFPDTFLSPSQILCKTHRQPSPNPLLISAKLTICQPELDQTSATLHFRPSPALPTLRTSNLNVEAPTHAHTASPSPCQFTTLSTTQNTCTLQWPQTTYPQYISMPLSAPAKTTLHQTLRLKVPGVSNN